MSIQVFFLFELQIDLLHELLFLIIAQIQFVSQDTISGGANEVAYNKTDKSFDCFMECIKDTTCRRLLRLHPHTNSWSDCYKKTSTTLTTTTQQDAQYAVIKGLSYLN